ncbi:MAG: N-acetyl sugar amidotransferase [Flavobacteriales bacterium]|nr:N-acetyl sugar amidotransferase [Bacteroidota bacterium]MCB9239873.1 N-acetyl sugar amidotransferase [Flavobacteriales bacterium]
MTKSNSTYQICAQCVMDTVGNPEITFDDKGICNYCYEYQEKASIRLFDRDDERKTAMDQLIDRIKSSGESKPYDCLIGVSGGVDSTYTAYLVKQLGLRPLAVHFDNGWNSELAVSNIEKILDNLGIDLHTFVVDWEEFKDLQLSFLKASTPDGEIPTDHAILSTLYSTASKFGIKYIISGNNFKTEGVMPRLWAYGHIDWKYIRNVHKRFGTKRLKTFPHLSLAKFVWYTFIKRVKLVSILNYTDYDRESAMKLLIDKLEWQYYGGKHYESNYTKFYQGYILPEKFKIDKRKLHLSAYILAGLKSRQEALEELKAPIYPPERIAEDTEYIIKKFDIPDEVFNDIMQATPKTFLDYPTNYPLHSKLRNFLSTLRSKGLYHR